MANYLASIFGTEQDKGEKKPSLLLIALSTSQMMTLTDNNPQSTAPFTTRSARAATAIAARANTSNPRTRRRSSSPTSTKTRPTTPNPA